MKRYVWALAAIACASAIPWVAKNALTGRPRTAQHNDKNCRRLRFPTWGTTTPGHKTAVLRGGSDELAVEIKQSDIGIKTQNETSTSGHGEHVEANYPQSRTKGKWRSQLPDNLRSKNSKTLQKLRLGQTEIYLLGTAHVSNDSAADTRILLDHLEPECIFVELCDTRISLLEGGDDDRLNDAKNLTFVQKVREAREAEGGSRLFAISSILLTSWQEDFATDLGVELGGEFRQAHKYWLSHPSSHLVLGDRPLTLTLNRAWESLSWWPKIKVVLGLLWSSLRKPKKDEIKQWLESIMKEESDVLTKSMAELRQSFPTLYTSIIEERDAWIAAKLLQTCRALQGQKTTVVVLIGAGHMDGVCRWLTNPSTQSPEKVLSKLVCTKKWAKDEVVQKEAIPTWIHHVSELQRP